MSAVDVKNKPCIVSLKWRFLPSWKFFEHSKQEADPFYFLADILVTKMQWSPPVSEHVSYFCEKTKIVSKFFGVKMQEVADL